jgi:hypothetical protein
MGADKFEVLHKGRPIGTKSGIQTIGIHWGSPSNHLFPPLTNRDVTPARGLGIHRFLPQYFHASMTSKLLYSKDRHHSSKLEPSRGEKLLARWEVEKSHTRCYLDSIKAPTNAYWSHKMSTAFAGNGFYNQAKKGCSSGTGVLRLKLCMYAYVNRN